MSDRPKDTARTNFNVMFNPLQFWRVILSRAIVGDKPARRAGDAYGKAGLTRAAGNKVSLSLRRACRAYSCRATCMAWISSNRREALSAPRPRRGGHLVSFATISRALCNVAFGHCQMVQDHRPVHLHTVGKAAFIAVAMVRVPSAPAGLVRNSPLR